MLINIMQAVLLAVLLMFPFKSDISNYVQSYQMKNACAVADSAIVKYYIHNSTLPEELDSQFLEKLGLEADAAEDMSYEKLEERKFSLSYEDPASKEIRYSIHSNVLLPQNMDLNFGEVKEKYYPIQVEESDHQTVTVKVTYPDGSIITLHEGHKFEVPANSHFEVTVVSDEGWTAGISNVTDGSVIKDLVVNVSAAQVKNYTLTVENCVNQKVIIRVEDVHNGKTFEMNQNQSVRVGYETRFSLIDIVPKDGYIAGSVTPSSGVVENDIVIKVEDASISKPVYTEMSWTVPGEYLWTVPSGVTRLRVAVCGGGSGGVVQYNRPGTQIAGDGGVSSFGTLLQATGAKGLSATTVGYNSSSDRVSGWNTSKREAGRPNGRNGGYSVSRGYASGGKGFALGFDMKDGDYGKGGRARGYYNSDGPQDTSWAGESGGYNCDYVDVKPLDVIKITVGSGGKMSALGEKSGKADAGNSGFVLIAYGGDI